MTVREVLLLAASFLDEKDLAASLAGSSVTGEAETLLTCFNVVENEIALDDYPLKKTETFSFEKGILPFSKFSSAPVDICAVKAGGRKLSFSLTATGVLCDCDTAEITYTYAPKKKGIGDSAELGGRVSARLMALGVASEYCFVKGMNERAKIWGVKYRDALKCAGILRHPLSVRSRRWA